MITDFVFDFARIQSKSPAVISDGAVYDYGTFHRAIQATQRYLASIECAEKRTAVVLTRNLFDSWLAIISLRSLGYTTISIGTLAQLDQLNISDVSFVVITEAEHGLHDFQTDLTSDTPLVTVPGGIYRDILDTDLAEPLHYGAFGDHIVYSSGTTGNYKKLVISYSSEAPKLNHWKNTLDMNETTRFHCFDFGLWTAIGYATPLAVWQLGGCVILDQTPQKYSNFFKLGVTDTIVIAPIAQELARLFATPAGAVGTRFQKLREFTIGGSFVNQALAEKVSENLTQKLNIGYGSTELGVRILNSPYKVTDDLLWLNIGKDIVLEVVDADGQVCAAGDEGDLRVKLTDRDCQEYLDDPETTARFFKDGYFYPGDMAVTAADGRVRVLGRTSDVLSVAGQKLAVAPIEQELEVLLGVEEVCVFSGLTSDGVHELVVAVRSPVAPGPDKLDLVKQRFSMFGSVRFVTLSSFPRTTNGMMKTSRVDLRKAVLAST